MEVTASSSADRSQVGHRRDPQKSRVANGSAVVSGVDQRCAWVRRLKEHLSEHLSDVPDASAAERSIIRRASVLTVELERMETAFALAGEADPETLDLYARTAGNLRRLLEAVGLRPRPRLRDVTPDPLDYAREHSEAVYNVHDQNSEDTA
jgi:hypothetical protein